MNHKLPNYDADSDVTPSAPPSPCPEFSTELDCQQQHPVVISPETDEHISEAVKHWDFDEETHGMTPPFVSDGEDHHVTLLPAERRKIYVTGFETPHITDRSLYITT